MDVPYRQIRRNFYLIVVVLVASFAAVSFIIYWHDAKIDAIQDRISNFHEPTIIKTLEVLPQLEALRVQAESDLNVVEDHHATGEITGGHSMSARGTNGLYKIKRQLESVIRLNAEKNGVRYHATIEDLSYHLGQMGQDLELNISQSNLVESAEQFRSKADLLRDLSLTVNQLQKLHVTADNQLHVIRQDLESRQSSIVFPLSALILIGALVGLVYVMRHTKLALQGLQDSETKLQLLNQSLEQRVELRTRELEESQMTYKALFENAPIAYYNIGPDGFIRRWNRATELLFGASGDELTKKHVTKLCAEESLPTARRVFERFIKGEGSQNVEMTYLNTAGEKSYALHSVTPVLDDDGNVLESLSMDVDITEQRVAQDRAADMQQELMVSQKLATIGQLTATVSHELRNPLGAIRSASDAIEKMVGGKEARLDRALALLERSQVRCDKVIADLLNFTRVHSLNLEPTNLREWLADFMRDYPIPPDITLHSELNLDVTVGIDRDRLERALSNVVDNACQAMQNDDKAHGHVLTVTARLADGRAEIIIKDTGPGIPEENISKLFEPLFSTKSFGVGLGLPIVRQIMEQHSGGVGVRSQLHHGTEFTLWIEDNTSV